MSRDPCNHLPAIAMTESNDLFYLISPTLHPVMLIRSYEAAIAVESV